MQLDHTLFLGKSRTMLALCHDLKAGDYAQNYAGIIFSSLLCQSRAAMKGMYLPCWFCVASAIMKLEMKG